MAINKAQGQTFDLGVDLVGDAFSHGQLYVAFSRVKAWSGVKVKLDEDNTDGRVNNIVYQEFLDK